MVLIMSSVTILISGRFTPLCQATVIGMAELVADNPAIGGLHKVGAFITHASTFHYHSSLSTYQCTTICSALTPSYNPHDTCCCCSVISSTLSNSLAPIARFQYHHAISIWILVSKNVSRCSDAKLNRSISHSA